MTQLTRSLRRRFGKSGSKTRATRHETRRRFFAAEQLEDRRLLAGDASPFQNPIIPYDVNFDFKVSPVDAMMVINRLNASGSGKLEAPAAGEGAGEAPEYVDVNGDGFVSPVDVLYVINRLNAEGVGEVIGFSVQVTDLNNNVISSVGVGGQFKLRGFVQDLRSFPTQPTGVFSFFSDVEVTNYNLASIIYGETQQITLGRTTTGGSFTLNRPSTNQTVTVQIQPNFDTITANIQTAADTLFGAGNTRVVRTPFIDPEDDNRPPAQQQSNPFIWQVRFIGNLSEMPIENLVANGQGLQVSSGTPSAVNIELHPADPNNAGTFASSFNFEFNRLDVDYTNGNTARQVTGLGQSGNNGRIDEIGGVADVFSIQNSSARGNQFLMWEGIFRANTAGTMTFMGGAPDDSVSDILFFNNSNEVDPAMVDFGQAVTLNIVSNVLAVNDTFTVDENSLSTNPANNFDVLANDQLVVGTQKRLQSFTQSANGTVTRQEAGAPGIAGDTVRFQPTTSFSGVTTFTYVMSNENGDTSTATVTVTVTGINDTPIPTNDNATIAEDTTLTLATSTVTANDSPGAGEQNQTLTVTSVTGNNGTATLNGGNIIFTPTANFNGNTTILYVVTDNGVPAKSATGTINVTVTPVNDPPTTTNDTRTTTEDTALTISATSLTSNDSPGPANESTQTLTITAVSSPSAQNGTVQINGANVIYTPAANFFGSDTFTYTITDNGQTNGANDFKTATATVTVSVTAENDAPVAVNDNDSVDELTTDNPIDVLANDNPGPNEAPPVDAIRVVKLGNAAEGAGITTANGGTVTIGTNGANVLYTPSATFAGTDTFTYTIRDNGGLEATATVTIDVVPVVRPRAVTDRPSFPEGSTSVSINVLINDLPNTMPTTATATLKSVNQPPAGQGTVSIDTKGTATLTDDTVIYTAPDLDFNTAASGPVIFTYVMNDTFEGTGDGGVDSTGTVSLTITEVNDAPAAVNDNQTTAEDTALTISASTLTSNDSKGPANESTQTLTITSVSAASAQGGTVQLNGTNVIYTPKQDYNSNIAAVDTFTYVVRDNGKTNGVDDFKTSTGTVTVTVTPVNDAPIAVNDTQTTAEDIAATISISLLTSNDRPGPATATDEIASQTVIFGAASSTSAQGGTIVQNNGAVVYTPKLNFNGTDTFTYTITDSGANSATVTGTVTMTVTAVNDAPIPGADPQATAFKDQTLTISVAPLLANDSPGPTDESGQVLSVSAVQANTALGGTATLSANGQTIIYVPPSGIADQIDTITYTVADNGSPSATAQATLQVNIRNFQPSTVGGFVYVDANNNGQMAASERRLGGVEVRLTGTDFATNTVNRTAITDLNGKYTFGNVAPGQYMLSASTPAFYRDGIDTAGLFGDTDSVNDQFTFSITAPGGFNATGYHFGELGLEAQYASVLDLLASTPSHGGYSAVDQSGNPLWTAPLAGYETAKFSEFVLNSTHTSALLTIVDENDNVLTAELDMSDFHIRSNSSSILIRYDGARTAHDFQTVNRANPPSRPSFPTYLDSVDKYFAQFGTN